MRLIEAMARLIDPNPPALPYEDPDDWVRAGEDLRTVMMTRVGETFGRCVCSVAAGGYLTPSPRCPIHSTTRAISPE